MSAEYGHAMLKSRLERFPLADLMSVVGADGRLIANSRVWPGSALDLSDRDYFQHFKNSAEKRTYISLPLANRATGLPTVFFVKPIRDGGGALLGLVAVGVPIAHFRHIYETVGLLGDLAFLLARTDGTILVRYPDKVDRAGQKVPLASPWYDAVRKGGGQFRSLGKFIPQKGAAPDVRLVSARLVAGYPLATAVGMSENAALAAWRQRSLFIAVGTLLAMICSFILLSAIAQQVRLLKKSEASLAEQKDILAAKSYELAVAKAQTD